MCAVEREEGKKEKREIEREGDMVEEIKRK